MPQNAAVQRKRKVRTDMTMNDAEPLLRLHGIGKNFGPVTALSDIDLDIPPGQVTALVGDNGAGKSTLIKTISGIFEPSHGEMFWQGKHVNFHTPKDATDTGIATVYQDLALCDNLDIVQNMLLGHEVRSRAGLLDEISMEQTAKKTLSDLRVTTVRHIRQPVRASRSPPPRRSSSTPSSWSWTTRPRPSASPRRPSSSSSSAACRAAAS